MSDDLKFSVFDDDVGKDDFVRRSAYNQCRLDLLLLRPHLYALTAVLGNG